jgi:hypothetical protein
VLRFESSSADRSSSRFVERGYEAIRFEGRVGLAAVFGAVWVTNMASPRRSVTKWNRVYSDIRGMKTAA